LLEEEIDVTVELGMDLAKAGLRELLFPLSFSSAYVMILKKVTFMTGESEQQGLTRR